MIRHEGPRSYMFCNSNMVCKIKHFTSLRRIGSATGSSQMVVLLL